MLWRSGETDKAPLWIQKAFELAKGLGAPDVLSRCYNDLGVLAGKNGDFEKASDYYEKGLKVAFESNLPAGHALTVYNNLAELYWSAGEFQKTFETAQKGTEMAKKVGALYNFTWIYSLFAASYAYMGEIQKAVFMFEEILELDKRIKQTSRLSMDMLALGLCSWVLGDWGKSLQYMLEAWDLAKAAGEYQFSGGVASELGGLFTEMEDYVEAEKYLNESNTIFQSAGDASGQCIEVFPALSKLYLKKGDSNKAEELIEKAYEYAVKTKSRLILSEAEMLKAMLFREQKKWGQSVEHFEKSLQEHKSMNSQKWYVTKFAELLYEYGLMYLKRNGEGDKEEAYSLLDQALEIYRRIDAKKMIEKIIATKKLLTA